MPPYLRVVEPSAWANGWKMRACASSVSPMPVSTISKSRVASVAGHVLRAHVERHLAFFGELDRVGKQVEQAPAAAAPRRRRGPSGTLGVHEADQFQPLALGAFGEDFDGAFDRLADVEVEHLERQLARFDLGEIEDVVDDGQQRVRAGLHGQGELALLDVELGVDQQAATCR